MRLAPPYTQIVSLTDDSGFGWTPLTASMRSIGITHALMSVNLQGLGAMQVKPGFQYSDDGIVWDAVVQVDIGTNDYADTEDWTYGVGFTDIEALAGEGAAKQFIRFGLLCYNFGETGKVETADAQLSINVRPVVSGTWRFGPQNVNSQGTHATDAFTPLSGAIETATFNELRVAEMTGTTGSGPMRIKAGYQLSNDGVAWDSEVALDEEYSTTPVVVFGDDPEAAAFTKRFIRFGVIATNPTSVTGVFGCMASLVIDWRCA